MARTLISSSPFFGTVLPSKSYRHGIYSLPHRSKIISTTVKFSFQEIPPISSIDSSIDLSAVFSRAESLIYTLADAAVTASPDASVAPVQKNGGWFGFISDAMEVVLKVLKDGLSTLHVPYSYGFAIILLTVLVKVATFPLTKQQVESTMAMQNLQPKIKAIQERYKGNQERIQLETSRLYKQAGVNPLAGCLPTLATIPVWIGLYQALSNVANEDGHPPIGWSDTAAYLVLPVLLVVSQYVSMELMKPPQTDPSQKNSLLVLKFLPLMIGYFSLSVPSGLSIYWFTNNVLSTAQQVWLRKFGGAKPVVNENASGIISAGKAKRSVSQPAQIDDRSRQFKGEVRRQEMSKALPDDQASVIDSEIGSDDELKETDELEEAYASSSSKQNPKYSTPKKSKRSKRKRVG
uniref:Membrane insertase YidC/Oxa/ALB C-terminal domain-containing protein n=1 Tax=Chenopodium quinoa TaxID=63459 RepID=A0A803KS03_CHEQI